MLTDATVVPAKVLNGFFGPLLIGTWFNLLLLGIEIVQLANYIKLFPSDAVWIRIFISSMVCVDVINTCGVCGLAYACTVLGWGDMTVLNFSNINFSVFAVAMSIGVLMMHTFLILRYYGLSKNLVVSLLLCVPALVACGGGLSISWAAATKFVAASDRPKLRIYVTVVSSGSFGADVCITAAVMYELHRVTTTFERTQSLIRRLMRNSLLSGCATSTLALLSLITFSKLPMTNIALIFSMNISRVSTITVLYNLNDRCRARSELESEPTSVEMNVSASARFHESRAISTQVHQIGSPQTQRLSVSLAVRREDSDTASTTTKVRAEDIV